MCPREHVLAGLVNKKNWPEYVIHCWAHLSRALNHIETKPVKLALALFCCCPAACTTSTWWRSAWILNDMVDHIMILSLLVTMIFMNAYMAEYDEWLLQIVYPQIEKMAL